MILITRVLNYYVNVILNFVWMIKESLLVYVKRYFY